MGRRNRGPKDVFEMMQEREGYRLTRGFLEMDPYEFPFEEDELPDDLELELMLEDPTLDDIPDEVLPPSGKQVPSK